MDNFVLDQLSPEDQERLARLQEELGGLDLIALLEELMKRFGLSVSRKA